MKNKSNQVWKWIIGSITFGMVVFSLKLLNDSVDLFRRHKIDHSTQFNRKFASLPITPKIISIQLDCQEAMHNTVTSSDKIKIKGQFCSLSEEDMQAKIEFSRIINLTNGFLATVFKNQDKNNFSTDYIYLSRGENTIDIRYRFRNGDLIQDTIRIVRK